MALKDILPELRRERGLTQEDLANDFTLRARQ